MITAQGFCSMFQYYLSLLEQGVVLEASFRSQTWHERWFYDPDKQMFGIYETDIHQVTATLDKLDFVSRVFSKRDELCEITQAVPAFAAA